MSARGVLAGSAAVAVAAVLAVGATSWWLGRSGDVDVPSDDATAEQVVTAYVEAINARDTGTLAALRRDHALPVQVTENVLLEGRATYADLQVRPAREDVSGDPVSDATTVAYVPVEFDLHRTWAPFPDVSMPPGPTGWGYLLERETPDDPWRITGEGVG